MKINFAKILFGHSYGVISSPDRSLRNVLLSEGKSLELNGISFGN